MATSGLWALNWCDGTLRCNSEMYRLTVYILQKTEKSWPKKLDTCGAFLFCLPKLFMSFVVPFTAVVS